MAGIKLTEQVRTLNESMQTYGRPVFVGKQWLTKDAPRFHVAPTTEIEHPWRVCKKSLVFRYRPDKGIVIGIWRKNHRDWYDTVLEALKGREIEAEGSIGRVPEDLEFI